VAGNERAFWDILREWGKGTAMEAVKAYYDGQLFTPEGPVKLANGHGRYVIVDIEEYEKTHAALKLMMELEKGRVSGEREGWSTLEEIKKEFDLSHFPELKN
jgi:hypothetical protein